MGYGSGWDWKNDAVPTASQVEVLFTVRPDVLDPLYWEPVKSNFRAILELGMRTTPYFVAVSVLALTAGGPRLPALRVVGQADHNAGALG